MFFICNINVLTFLNILFRFLSGTLFGLYLMLNYLNFANGKLGRLFFGLCADCIILLKLLGGNGYWLGDLRRVFVKGGLYACLASLFLHIFNPFLINLLILTIRRKVRFGFQISLRFQLFLYLFFNNLIFLIYLLVLNITDKKLIFVYKIKWL